MIKNKHMLFCDFPTILSITEPIKNQNLKRVFTGGVRINSGMYRTNKQDNEYRSNSLKRKLP